MPYFAFFDLINVIEQQLPQTDHNPCVIGPEEHKVYKPLYLVRINFIFFINASTEKNFLVR